MSVLGIIKVVGFLLLLTWLGVEWLRSLDAPKSPRLVWENPFHILREKTPGVRGRSPRVGWRPQTPSAGGQP